MNGLCGTGRSSHGTRRFLSVSVPADSVASMEPGLRGHVSSSPWSVVSDETTGLLTRNGIFLLSLMVLFVSMTFLGSGFLSS